MNISHIGLMCVGLTICISGWAGMSCVSSRNEFSRQEEGILAEHKNNQNKLLFSQKQQHVIWTLLTENLWTVFRLGAMWYIVV